MCEDSVQISHGGSQGFKPPDLHPTTQQVRASPYHHRRRSRRSLGCLWPHWGHGLPAQPNDGLLGGWAAPVEHVQAVAERGVGLPGTGGRSAGSGGTVLACPTPSRKRPTNQPAPEPAEAGSLD